MSDLRSLCRILAALGAAMVMACGAHETDLARVGGQTVGITTFQSYVSDVTGEAWQAVSAHVLSGLLDQYLDRQVVLEAARRREVSLPDSSSTMGPSEVQWLLDELCGPAPNLTADEIATEVGRRAEHERPAKAHVRQLLVDSHEEGLEALRLLNAGENFVEVSRNMSRAPNAADGGELGFFDQGALSPEIDAVIFSLAPGEFSEPVQGPSGYHVFQVLEVIPAGPPDLAEVEAAVRSEFTQKKIREHTRGCIQRLSTRIEIEIYDTNLWFPYTGRYADG